MASKKINLLVCPDCAGMGRAGGRKCKACHSIGAGVFFGGHFLYWGGAKSASDVYGAKFSRFIAKIIDGALILFGIYGFLNLAYYVYTIGARNLFIAHFWSAPNSHLFIFFAGLCGLLYFGMRSTRLIHQKESAVNIGFGEDPTGVSSDWQDIKNFKKSDVSRALSVFAEKTIEDAYLLAKKYSSPVLPEHIFLALLRQSKVQIIFGRLGVPAKILEGKVSRNLVKANEKHIVFSPSAKEAIYDAYIKTVKNRSRKLEVNFLLLAVVEASEFLREALYDLNVDATKLGNVVAWIDIQDKLYRRWQEFRRASVFRRKGAMNRAMTAMQTPVLDRVSEDLTAYAKAGVIDFCIGREEIFSSLFRVIEAGGKGSVLVGERGVGKSAVVDGLAEMMIKEDVPKILRDKRLVRLSVSEIMGGATSEESGKRLMMAIGEAVRAGNIVLEIPNLEYFANEGGLALASLLAEELKKSALPVFASITPEGYKAVVEDTALSAIFERLDVEEPDTELAIRILEAESSAIEYKNRVYFSYDALSGAVALSDKYLHERFLPDKAIEIIKEAALHVREKRGVNSIVGLEDIATIVSEKSKIPVSAVTESEKEKLLKLESIIKSRIVGQKEAVEAVSSALRRARSGLREGKRPIANFLFLGPTGVGKTELAKTIAEVYFGSEDAMVRVDMSEYQEKTSVYKMIGEGGEPGYLTEAVRRKPFTLVLLDELEKAHADILNLFLQVMDDGRLTDGKGRTIDFTNVILVATSNAGSDYIAKEVSAGTNTSDIKEGLLRERLGNYFRPEFLNRFDGVIVFSPLSKDETVEITRLLCAKVAKAMEKKGVELIIEEPALRELAVLGYDPKFGARPLRRVIAKEVEDRLANLLLGSKVRRRDKIVFHSMKDVEILPAKKL